MNKREPVYLEGMVWKPGQGTDPARLHNLMGLFGKPTVPLGEAWFMGETRFLHDNLNAQGIEGATELEVGGALDDLISGLAFFPRTTAWPEWYGYLTPFTEAWWHGELCTGLLALSLCNPEEHVSRYEADFAAVLSPWIMNSSFWSQGGYLPLREKRGWRDSWGVFGVDASISISLLFTWRYLRPEALRPWLHSILAIEDVLWKAHFVLWLMRV
jgi:hypothetical protein